MALPKMRCTNPKHSHNEALLFGDCHDFAASPSEARPVQQPATEPDEQRTRLLKIASKVAQRQYLPSLEKCRTINDARIEVARYDEYHAALAQQLKDVFDASALRDVPQGPDDREIVAEWRSCLCAAWASGHRAVMTILLESGPSYPARQAPVGPEGKK